MLASLFFSITISFPDTIGKYLHHLHYLHLCRFERGFGVLWWRYLLSSGDNTSTFWLYLHHFRRDFELNFVTVEMVEVVEILSD
jgi:hypothetical protein